MKAESSLFCAIASRHLVLLALVLLPFAGPIQAQITITLNNAGSQNFAFDPSRHFLYSGQNDPTVHNLNVINTLTNSVVGSTTYSGGYSSQVAASGTDVFWADQGSSLVRVFSVNGSGVPSAGRTDAATLATGLAALSTTYAVSKQGGGDFLDIRLTSTGATLFTTNLGGVAGNVLSDSNTNRYYARSTNNFQVIDATNGSIVRTLGGQVAAIDSVPAHNFVYLGAGAQILDQLTGGTNVVNTFYDFGSGASITDVAINSLNGDIFVALQSQNRVVQLTSSMSFVQEFTVANAQSLAVADGQLFVHSVGTNYLNVIAVPEPATWSVLLGSLGLILAVLRRRAARSPA